MMEKAELEYDDLDKKRRIIERDRGGCPFVAVLSF